MMWSNEFCLISRRNNNSTQSQMRNIISCWGDSTICEDGSKKCTGAQLNDDFCNCSDGSNELDCCERDLGESFLNNHAFGHSKINFWVIQPLHSSLRCISDPEKYYEKVLHIEINMVGTNENALSCMIVTITEMDRLVRDQGSCSSQGYSRRLQGLLLYFVSCHKPSI